MAGKLESKCCNDCGILICDFADKVDQLFVKISLVSGNETQELEYCLKCANRLAHRIEFALMDKVFALTPEEEQPIQTTA